MAQETSRYLSRAQVAGGKMIQKVAFLLIVILMYVLNIFSADCYTLWHTPTKEFQKVCEIKIASPRLYSDDAAL